MKHWLTHIKGFYPKNRSKRTRKSTEPEFRKGSIKQNITANFFGKGFSSLVSLVFIPCYISLLGLEGVGLISFFNTLISLSYWLDFGLGTVASREIARLNVCEEKREEIYCFAKAFEKKGFFLSSLYGLMVVSFSTFLAGHWLHFVSLSTQEVKWSLIFMGVAMIFQWPVVLYNGFFVGLENQKFSNIIQSIGTLVRYGGGWCLLIYLNSSTITFFVWQCFVSMVQLILLRHAFFSQIPRVNKKLIIDNQFKQFSRFAAGASLFFLIFNHLDKIVLSNYLSLEQFGIYSVCASIASGLLFFIHPISSSYFPRFASLFSMKCMEEVKRQFWQAMRIILYWLIPCLLFLLVFSKEVLSFSLGGRKYAGEIQEGFILLVIGYLLHGLMILPYCLLMALGMAKKLMQYLLWSIIVLTLGLIILVPKHALWGAALAWAIANALYLILGTNKIKSLLILRKEAQNSG